MRPLAVAFTPPDIVSEPFPVADVPVIVPTAFVVTTGILFRVETLLGLSVAEVVRYCSIPVRPLYSNTCAR